MKRFYGYATTTLEGLDFGQHFVVSADSLASAHSKVDKEDWTHGDGIEEEMGVSLHEIPEEHYNILKEYILEI